MSSRTKRKRYRRRLAKASVAQPCWDWARNVLSFDDLRLIRHASFHDWDPTETVKRSAIAGLMATLKGNKLPGGSVAKSIAAALVAIRIDFDGIRRTQSANWRAVPSCPAADVVDHEYEQHRHAVEAVMPPCVFVNDWRDPETESTALASASAALTQTAADNPSVSAGKPR